LKATVKPGTTLLILCASEILDFRFTIADLDSLADSFHSIVKPVFCLIEIKHQKSKI